MELNSLCFGFSRQVNIVHVQLIMQCSNLNYHLVNLHVVDSPSCRCSYKWPLYTSKRQKLLSVVEQICVVHVQVLLFGISKHSYVENRVIFKSVEVFILESNVLL